MLQVSAPCLFVFINNLPLKTQISPLGDTVLPSVERWFLEAFLRSKGNVMEGPWFYFGLKTHNSTFTVF